MSNVKINIAGNTLELSGGYDYFSTVDGFYKTIMELKGIPTSELSETKPVLPLTAPQMLRFNPFDDMQQDVVAIYDDAGIPSIMHRFRKIRNKDLFGGNCGIHRAFTIGGKTYDEIFISVYPNCEINGKPYSLPYMKPWVNITNDDAAKACFSKGDGWHMLTAAEWGLLANTSLALGTLPHGNTSSGKYHADPQEKGVLYDNYHTLTGSGPSAWTHNHKPTGVHDLCGNVWEMVRGMRLMDGRLQAAKDNDAALDIDLTLAGGAWQDVTDDNGKPVFFSVDDESGITIKSEGEISHACDGAEWQDVPVECKSEQLKEFALFAGEPEAYLYADADGERFLLCGGNWSSTTYAGVFHSSFSYARSPSSTNFGFRSAYFCKL
ncbi:MAG: SUMF1/EgtB/PvdO family nonheme iron enzyme [Oscillospiraceae bacterium]|nr:SUMF1/EgtB/PvdO family nonheme iron enzyme [Oscillospiraceae bacterium]